MLAYSLRVDDDELFCVAQSNFNFCLNFPSTTHKYQGQPGCMRFLLRVALLSALLFAMFLVALTIQRHFFDGKAENQRDSSQSKTANPAKIPARTYRRGDPSEEDKEVRRLLLLAGAQPGEGVAKPPQQQQQQSGGAAAISHLETAVGAGLLFPIGRYPQSGRGTGTGANAVGAGQLTLNVAVVLVVSLLSIAVLITAICCVIIIALAMDSATNADGGPNNRNPLYRDRTSTSSPSHAADFLLSNWPNLMFPQPLDPHSSAELAKLFRPENNNFFSNGTPPLTDDEVDLEEDMGMMSYGEDRERLVLVEESETGRSWPATVWNKIGRATWAHKKQQLDSRRDAATAVGASSRLKATATNHGSNQREGEEEAKWPMAAVVMQCRPATVPISATKGEID